MAKAKVIENPIREPDLVSKRGVYYWFAPEWVRGTSSYNDTFGKIAAVKETNGEVLLYMKSKTGHYNYIQGSIQEEFKKWHMDRSIDYLLLGMDIDELIKDE
jgi:hypothetical protein